MNSKARSARVGSGCSAPAARPCRIQRRARVVRIMGGREDRAAAPLRGGVLS